MSIRVPRLVRQKAKKKKKKKKNPRRDKFWGRCPFFRAGVDFVNQSLLFGGTLIRLQVWDSAGQERFRAIVPAYEHFLLFYYIYL
jgi:GTPase SAR1 family protein